MRTGEVGIGGSLGAVQHGIYRVLQHALEYNLGSTFTSHNAGAHWNKPGQDTRNFTCCLGSQDFHISQCGGLLELTLAEYGEAGLLSRKPWQLGISRHAGMQVSIGHGL